MSYELIEVKTSDDIGTLRLNQPDKLNAVSVAMLEEISDAVDVLAKSVRVVIVTSAGRAFCSGAALDHAPNPSAGTDRDFGAMLESHINPLMSKLRRLPIPWITAVRGAAAGVGASLALAADLVVAGETAYFLQAFARIGLVPDGGSTHLLTRTIGRVRAMELMLLADRLPARKALEWGLVNRVVPDGALEQEARGLAEALARGPTMTLGLIRESVWNACDAPWDEVLQLERKLQSIAGRTQDCLEGIAAFNEKRAASFQGK